MSHDRSHPQPPRPGFDDAAFAATMSALAFAVLAFAGSALAAEPPSASTTARPAVARSTATVDNGPAASGAAANFTGTYDRGVPVYRLPAVTVVGTRPVTTARAAAAQTPARAGVSGGRAG